MSPGSTITYTLPSATDYCGADTVTVTGDPAPGSTLSPGVTTVTCTVVNNAHLTDSCSFLVVVPNPTLTDAYVDATYGSLVPGTMVAWPNTSGSGTHYIGYDAFATVQGGVNAVEASGTVHVAAGTYTENVTVSKAVTLLGANHGTACGGAGSAVINGGTGAAVAIGAGGVTVDGFALEGAVGVSDLGGYVGVAIVNNKIMAGADRCGC